MKIGFIGAGNMGGAIIRGLVKHSDTAPSDILFSRSDAQKGETLSKETGAVFTDTKNVINNCDIVFLAVKPYMIENIISAASEEFAKAKPILVSMAAGVGCEKIEKMLSDSSGRDDIEVIRIMPNVNAAVGKSVTAVCKGKNAADESIDRVKDLLGAIGSCVDVPENQFAVFSAIAGCSPAYVYMFIDALAEAALKAGMPKAKALEIAAGAVEGSAAMYLATREHPAALADKVCSPGGTTIEGVCTLKQRGFESTVIAAVDASVEKDKKLGK